jgi:DNA (cytosine-5)-methyltransferase 1
MGQTYIGDNVGNTLGARDFKQPQAGVYGMCSYDSNSMKSTNPHSGIYEAETTRTLDNNGGNPACNQGGMIVLEGNGQRDSHKGDGYKESETMYTLNTVEQHGVCTYQQTTGALTPGAHPGSYNGQDAYNDMLVVDKSPKTVTYGVDCYNQTQSKEVTKSLNAAATDSDHIPCVYGLDRASFNQGQNAQYDFSIEEETAQTLVSRGPGGGTEQTVGALCARDYKGVGNQYVNEGKCIIQRIE